MSTKRGGRRRRPPLFVGAAEGRPHCVETRIFCKNVTFAFAIGFSMITRNLGSLENRKVQDFLGFGCQLLVDFWNFAKSEIFRGISESSSKTQGRALDDGFLEGPEICREFQNLRFFCENVKNCKVPEILGR